jgi:ubiquinone/menaquinone biosynthesis C-methylase UbiE
LRNLTIIEKDVNTPSAEEGFAKIYSLLCKKEGRLYSNADIATLPFIYASHLHYNEWLIRKHSLKALQSYITNKKIFSNILEVGCGNGWLCARIAKETNAAVTGLDINSGELQQAECVFRNIPNLNFINGSLQNESLQDEKFDMILFAGSIQYFPSLKKLVETAVEHLTLQGEVHIMDSPFYQQQEIPSARQKTEAYYNSLGLNAMNNYCYYHTLNELENFQYKILHHPNSWKNKLSIKKNPFYWITIKNRYQ